MRNEGIAALTKIDNAMRVGDWRNKPKGACYLCGRPGDSHHADDCPVEIVYRLLWDMPEDPAAAHSAIKNMRGTVVGPGQPLDIPPRHWLEVGTCPKCGAPVMRDAHKPESPDCPPHSFSTCVCHSDNVWHIPAQDLTGEDIK